MHRSITLILILLFIIIFWNAVVFSVCDLTTPKIPVDWIPNNDKGSVKLMVRGSCAIPYKNRNMLFVGGEAGQSVDQIFHYENGRMAIWQTIDKSADVQTTSAICVILDGKITIIVARTDGLFKYTKNEDEVFVSDGEPFYKQAKGAIVSGISASDFDKSGRLSFYLACFGDPEFKKGSTARNELVMYNEDTRSWDNMADIYGCMGDLNSRAVAFVDLTGSGYPDIVDATVNGSVRIYKNEEGKFVMTKVDNMTPGAWMGLAVGDFDNSGRQSIFLSNDAGWNCILYNTGDYKFEVRDERGINKYGVTNKDISYGRGATVSDFNHDGRMDIAMAQSNGGKSLEYGAVLLRRDSRFARAYKFSNTNIGCMPVIADLTGDGRKEVAWINNLASPVVYVNVLTRKNNAVRLHIPMDSTMSNATATAFYENGEILAIQNIIGHTGSCMTFGTRRSKILKIEIMDRLNMEISQVIENPDEGSDFHV